jgi:AAA ATPase domain
MSGAFSSRVLVGRENELAELQAAFERAKGGAVGAMLVGGEAGVGKTRLLGELTVGARRDGALVLAGLCADLRDAGMPLLPIAEALAPLGPLPARASADLDDAERGVAAAVAVFAPVLELLREAAASVPVVLAVDDLQWADRSTLDLLTFLLAGLRDERLLVVLTFRSDEVDRRAELREFLAEAGRRPIVRRLELGRLTRVELGAQLAGILGRAPEARFADAVFARSAGNPLFAEELVEAASREGTEQLPATLRDMLLARIMALGPVRPIRRSRRGRGRAPHPSRAARRRGRPRGAAPRRCDPRGGPPSRPRGGRRRARLPPSSSAGGRLRRGATGRARAAARQLRAGARSPPRAGRRHRSHHRGRDRPPLVASGRSPP